MRAWMTSFRKWDRGAEKGVDMEMSGGLSPRSARHPVVTCSEYHGHDMVLQQQKQHIGVRVNLRMY